MVLDTCVLSIAKQGMQVIRCRRNVIVSYDYYFHVNVLIQVFTGVILLLFVN